jgi:hypothetical protein
VIQPHDVDFSGRRVRLWRGGSGPPLLLLQGGMADAALHWRPVWEGLAERFEVEIPGARFELLPRAVISRNWSGRRPSFGRC